MVGRSEPVRSVDDVFSEYVNRRDGLIKALTVDVDEFYELCSPDRENLCLYGLPNGDWDVGLPSEEVPAHIPEPVLGINFARDGMDLKHWLYLIAIHSDAWLMAVAFYFGFRFGFDKADRHRLFYLINDLPTISEVIKMPKMKKTDTNSKSNSKPRASEAQESNSSREMQLQQSNEQVHKVYVEVEEEEEEGETLCASCGETYMDDEFWICCDICERWFHGKCVKITPGRAEHIKQYKCPSCSKKRPHHHT